MRNFTCISLKVDILFAAGSVIYDLKNINNPWLLLLWNIDNCVWELLLQQSPHAGNLRSFDHPPLRHPQQWFTPCILFYILSSWSSISAWHMEPGFTLCTQSSRLQPGSAACPPPTTQLKPFVGPVGRGSLPLILRCCWRFNPHTVRNEVLLLSLLLLQLWSSPNVIRQWPWHDWPRNLYKKPREWRWGWRGGAVSDLTSNPREERNYSEGFFPMLLLCLVGNKGFMYSFYPGKNCNL